MVVSDLVVTALRTANGTTSGYYLQHPSRRPFGGIFVYSRARAAAVRVGDRVRVTGRYQEYFGLSELTEPSATVEDPAAHFSIEPLDVAPADIATGGALAEAYESMLVRVSGVAVTAANPDLPDDYDELAVSGDLRVDDRLLPELDNSYPEGTGFGSITGILDFSFGNTKVLPRAIGDLVR